MVQTTERNHSREVMVLPHAPRWVKVVPIEVRTTTSGNRTAEPNLTAKLSTDRNGRRRSVHMVRNYRIVVRNGGLAIASAHKQELSGRLSDSAGAWDARGNYDSTRCGDSAQTSMSPQLVGKVRTRPRRSRFLHTSEAAAGRHMALIALDVACECLPTVSCYRTSSALSAAAARTAPGGTRSKLGSSSVSRMAVAAVAIARLTSGRSS